MTNLDTFDLVLRRPRQSDADEIQLVLVETWIATYSKIFGHEKTATLANKFFSRWSVGLATQFAPEKILIADHSGEVTGVLFAYQSGFGRIFVSMLYVHPKWQRMGIGKVLLERLCELSPSGRSIRLEVLSQNTDGINFYRSLGFQVVREVQNAQGTGVPALLMEKAISPSPAQVTLPLRFWNRWLGGP